MKLISSSRGHIRGPRRGEQLLYAKRTPMHARTNARTPGGDPEFVRREPTMAEETKHSIGLLSSFKRKALSPRPPIQHQNSVKQELNSGVEQQASGN